MPSALAALRSRLQVLVLLAALLAFAGTANAAPLPGSSYDSGDGDQASGLQLDWQSAIATGLAAVAADRSNDDCFAGGNKELAPAAWAFKTNAGGCVPGKSNIRDAFVQAEPTAATTFAHFGLVRGGTTGDSFLAFELNQSTASWTNGAGTTIPCRQNGDLLLSFDIGGSSLRSVVYRWIGDGSGPPSCPDGAHGTFMASGTIGGSVFQGAMNPASSISNYADTVGLGGVLPANSFAEDAINLPAALASMGLSPCFGFAQMQVQSRSSTSMSSAMIDYLSPVPVALQSCAATGTVYQDGNGNGARDAGDAGLSGFTAYVDLNRNGTLDAGEPSGVTGSDGGYRILGIPAGSRTVRIVGQPGYACTTPSPCSHTASWVSGGNQAGLDFGLTGPSSASGTVYTDANANGARDAGEASLAGRTFYADYNGNGTLDAGEPSSTSDAFGAWRVTGIAAGSYAIRQVAAAGSTCSEPSPCLSNQTFTSNSVVTGLEFGDWSPASIAGNVFEDADGDGAAKVAGDTDLSGWQVYLDANGNGQFDLGETTTTTDGSGNYSFTGLTPGAYVVRETLASASYYCTNPSTTFAACQRALTLTSGQASAGDDFGNSRYATVSGQAYNDANASGVKDGSESGLAGVVVYVDYNGDLALSAGEPSATTDASGNFSLTGVNAGSWSLRSVPFGAYKCTQPATGCAYALALASGSTATGKVFGENLVRSVSGTLFKDANANGVKDSGEPGLSGWTVYSDNNNNSVLDAGDTSATTNGVGSYTLTGMPNGAYKIRIVGQSGYTCDYPGTGTNCLQTGSLGAAAGQLDTGKDFGVYTAGTVSGTIFEDTNGDGSAKVAGDAGLAGRTVWVDTNPNGVLDSGEPSATSGSDGTYTITGVANGTWTLRRSAVTGFTSTSPAGGTYSITVASNSLTGKDFGSFKPGTIAGQVFGDLDADGTKGAGETGVSGRTIYLDANNNGTLDSGETSVTTDGSGNYLFASVAAGTAHVRQVLPSGWSSSFPATSYDLSVVSQSAYTAKNFGTYTTGTISGRVFDDHGLDGGAYNAAGGDSGIAGRTVYVDANGNGSADSGETTTTTDGTGNYSFTGLNPGAYTVRTVTPANVACSYPVPCSSTVTVTSQSATTGRDFGTYTGGSVSGTVFEDSDADGSARVAGDAGLAGQRVYVDANDNGTRDAGEASTTTDAGGGYSFTGLTAATQVIRVDAGSGWACDSPVPCRYAVAVTSGSSAGGRDFGLIAAASIAGNLWTDSTGAATGVRQWADNPEPGRTVYVDANDNGRLDDGEATTTTDDSGGYAFSGLRPGSYVVREVLPTAWQCSTPAGACRHAVTLVSGQKAASADFSNVTTASISGTYYEDGLATGLVPDTDGVDTVLAGRTVYLDLNDNGTLDDGEPSHVTGVDGTYTFADLAPGSYVLRSADQPASWTCSYPADCIQSVTVESGEDAQDADFGAWAPASVSGTVYNDVDASATNDDGDTPMAGRTVSATPDGGGTPITTSTGGDGSYTLTGLAPGIDYTITVSRNGDTCSQPLECSYDITPTSSQVVTGDDFGLAGPATISGSVYDDSDASGSSTSGDSPISGRTVTATPSGGGTPATTTTGADGSYSIGGLAPGTTYAVTVDTGDGETCTQPAPCSYEITPQAGESIGDRSFGLYRTASVAGTVYVDNDADGADGTGDTPLGAVTVTASPAGGGTPISTVSATDGSYTLSGLTPGVSYAIEAAHDGATCSQPVGCSDSVTPTEGQAVTGEDFGRYTTASVAGIVYRDNDHSGGDSTGDSPLASRTVSATPDGGGTPLTTSTGTDGSYVITGLLPGTHYTISVARDTESCSQPAGCAYGLTPGSGESDSGDDFGLYTTASVAGTVYRDTNADGTDNGDDAGLSSRTVTATPAGGGDPITTTTTSGGGYVLTGLVPGTTYAITVDAADESCSQPTPCAYAVTPASGQSFSSRDFGLYALATASGTAYRDANADGVRAPSGDTGLSGRSVQATPTGGGTTRSATTADDGTYTITGLIPGVAYTISVAHVGEDCSQPSACDYAFTPASGQALTGEDFGLYRSTTVSGTVYRDADGSGADGAGDDPLANRTVTATPDGGGTPITTTSAGDGSYTLAGLMPGVTYAVTVDRAGEHCSQPTPCGYTVTPSSGDALTGRDFGLDVLATLSGTVYRDADASGGYDSTSEDGLNGRTVTATPAGDGSPVTTSTGADGGYSLTGLVPGVAYSITVDAAGEECSQPSPCAYSETPASGAALSGRDFGLYDLVTLTGRVYDDADGDGTRGDNENGLESRTVTVDPGTPDDPSDDTLATTDSHGTYTLSGRRPGIAYRISVSAEAHHSCTEPVGCSWSVTPSSGDGTVTRDFGIAADPASIAGTVWEDMNADGSRDAGDDPLAGRTVYLDANDDGVLDAGETTATTGSDGAYRFSGLRPGTYVVRKDPSSSAWGCSAPSDCRRGVTVGAGEDTTDADFGIWRTGQVGGTQFTDSDGNGARDAGEPTESGWVVYADLDGDGHHSDGEPTATTAADGSYVLSGLRPGQYRIREVPQDGRVCTAPANCVHSVDVRSFGSVTGRDFGAKPQPAPAPDPTPSPTPDPTPPVIGTPLISTPPSSGVPIVTQQRADGTPVYEVPRVGSCTPLTISIPIADAGGHLSEVVATLTPDDGGTPVSVALSPAGDGQWSGTLDCAQNGSVSVTYKVDGVSQTKAAGQVELIDPQGVVYDQTTYNASVARGLSAADARCMAALPGASVTLQRRRGSAFEDVPASDTGLAPQVNPERTGADGGYRWDVPSGDYRVRVALDGYQPATSRTVHIPPAVTDLDVPVQRLPGTAAPADRSSICLPTLGTNAPANPGCTSRPVDAWVRGSAVRRVRFLLDGRTIATLNAPNHGGRFLVTVHRNRLSPGAHRITAIVTLAHGRVRTLRIAVHRCLTGIRPRTIAGIPPGGGRRAYMAFVQGDTIGRVTFLLDGRVVGVLDTENWHNAYALHINPASLPAGDHRLTARITYLAGPRPRTATLEATVRGTAAH